MLPRSMVLTVALCASTTGSPIPGPGPSPSPSPTPSPAPTATPKPDPRPDAASSTAAREFAAEIARLSDQADAVDRHWRAYRARCGPEVVPGYEFGREWFALWNRDGAVLPRAADVGCGELLQRVVAEGGAVLTDLTAVESIARHGGVPEVTIRGLARWNGLEWRPLSLGSTQQAAAR